MAQRKSPRTAGLPYDRDDLIRRARERSDEILDRMLMRFLDNSDTRIGPRSPRNPPE